MPIEPNPLPLATQCDISKRYVRITEQRADGFVEFEFSVAWPELCVELIMLQADFEQFCQENQVEFLPLQIDKND